MEKTFYIIFFSRVLLIVKWIIFTQLIINELYSFLNECSKKSFLKQFFSVSLQNYL